MANILNAGPIVPVNKGTYDSTVKYSILNLVDDGLGRVYLSRKNNNLGNNLTDEEWWGRYTGKSAYDLAVENGYEGTETQWLASLKGDTGATGSQGPQGIKGDTGSSGFSGAAEDLEVVQITGTSEIAVMSQKAVTDEINTLYENLQEAEVNIFPHIYKDENIDISGLPLAFGAIQPDGSWTSVASTSVSRSIFIPVMPNGKYILSQGEGQGNNNYTIINTLFDTSINQLASNIDYATGYASGIELPAGNSTTIDIPSDGHYLIVRADLSDEGTAPTLIQKVTIDSRVDKIDEVLISKHQVTEAYFDHALLTLTDNAVTYTTNADWSSKILPVKDLIAIDIVATVAGIEPLAPPVVFLRGAEPTQENWIQGAEMYGSIATNDDNVKRLTASTFNIPAEATHVLLQNANSVSTDSWVWIHDIDTIRKDVDKIKSRIIVVDAKGNGDYTTISDAVNGTNDGDTILVYPGTYEESVHAFGKKRHIVGICKDTCILTNGTGNYATPPLKMNIGSIENMTIIADNYSPTIPNPSENQNNAAYGIHIEYANTDPYTIRISNCKIVSKWSAGIGLGLRYNQSVIIDNCELISECVRSWSDLSNTWVQMGGLFFHNDADSNFSGIGKLRVKDTILQGKRAALVMESIENKVGEVDAEFIGNTLVSEDYRVGNGVIYRWPGTTTPEGKLCGSKIALAITSHGNNFTELNV